MKAFHLLIVATASLLLSACQSGSAGTNNPAGPSPTAGAPAAIQLSIVRGLGTTADRGFLTGSVVDAEGHRVGAGIAVALSTTAGAIDVTPVSTDVSGQFTGAVTSANAATITAKAGTASVTAALPLSSNLPATLTVSVAGGSATTGVPFTLLANTPSGSQITSYRWTFGDEVAPVIPTDGGASLAHTYASAGSYTANVTVVDAIGRTATGGGTITVTNPPAPPPPPPPPPPPTLAATLTCVADALAHTEDCNVSATFNGASVASNAIGTAWDWGDGHLDATATTPIKSRTYPQPGTYTIIATVTAPSVTTTSATVSNTVTVN